MDSNKIIYCIYFPGEQLCSEAIEILIIFSVLYYKLHTND